MIEPTRRNSVPEARTGNEVASLARQLEGAQADRADVAARLLEAEQRVAALLRELTLATEQRLQAQGEVAALRASESWRITAPFRGVSRVLRRALRPVLGGR